MESSVDHLFVGGSSTFCTQIAAFNLALAAWCALRGHCLPRINSPRRFRPRANGKASDYLC